MSLRWGLDYLSWRLEAHNLVCQRSATSYLVRLRLLRPTTLHLVLVSAQGYLTRTQKLQLYLEEMRL